MISALREVVYWSIYVFIYPLALMASISLLVMFAFTAAIRGLIALANKARGE